MKTYKLPQYLFTTTNDRDNPPHILPEYTLKYDSKHNVNISFGMLTASSAINTSDGVLLTNVEYNSNYDDLTEDEVLNLINDLIWYYYNALGSETFAPSKVKP